MTDKEKKKKRILDKVIMGAVIGGAIGSVIGATVAPQEGKKTREELKEAAVSIGRGIKKVFHKIKQLFRRKSATTGSPAKPAPMKKIPHEPPAHEPPAKEPIKESTIDTTDTDGFFKDKS